MAATVADELISIGKASARVGVSASAIRFYDGANLIGELPRAGGRRMFDLGALTRLRFIKAAQALGFSLDEIRELLHPTAQPEWTELVATKRAELVRAQVGHSGDDRYAGYQPPMWMRSVRKLPDSARG